MEKMRQLIRDKLENMMSSYVNFEGASLKNTELSKIKILPKLMEEISSAIGIPLILIEGSIQRINLSLPWDALFREKDFVIKIDELRINARLPIEIQKGYLQRRRQKLIQGFMQKFTKKKQSQLNFLNQIKEYLFGSIVVHVRKITLEIEVQMKHSITVTLEAKSIMFNKDSKNKSSKVEVNGLSLSYHTKKSKREYIIKEAQISFIARSINGGSFEEELLKNLQVNQLQIEITNQNFNDVRRIIELIKWHNSFITLPQDLWKYKPPIIGSISAKAKLTYIVKIMQHKIRENNSILSTLEKRRQYIKAYTKFRMSPNNPEAKKQLEQVEATIDVWRAQEYRSFYLLKLRYQQKLQQRMSDYDQKFCSLVRSKSKVVMQEQEPSKMFASTSKSIFIPEKDNNDKSVSLNEQQPVGWWRSWYKTKEEKKQFNQLEMKLEELEQREQNTRDEFRLNIKEVKIKISIHSESEKQPFLNIFSTNNILTINSETHIRENKKQLDKPFEDEDQFLVTNSIKSNPSSEQIKITADKVTKAFSIERLMIQYDKFMGHDKTHRYLLHEVKDSSISKGIISKQIQVNVDEDDEDEFEDIENFLQFRSERNENHETESQMCILPVLISFNEEIIEKFSVFRFERIHNTFDKSQEKILEENNLSFEQRGKEKGNSTFVLSTSVYVQIPESVYEASCQSLYLGIESIRLIDKNDAHKQLFIPNIFVKALFQLPISSKKQHEEQHPNFSYQIIPVLKTSVQITKEIHHSRDELYVSIGAIEISFKDILHLLKLTKFVSKFKPKTTATKNRSLYRLKYMRRKQSIGEEFIDACENLNEHIVRSAVLSEKTTQQKYIVKEKKDIQTVIDISKIIVSVQRDTMTVTNLRLSLYQFFDNKKLISEYEQKLMKVEIKNIKKTLKNIELIKESIKRDYSEYFTNHDENINNSNRFSDLQNYKDLEGNVLGIKISSVSFSLHFYEEEKEKIFMNLTNIDIERSKQNTFFTVRANCEFGYYPSSNIKQPQFAIENFHITYQHEQSFNKDEKTLKINEFQVNIKPILIKEFGFLLQKMKTPDQITFKVSNKTVNEIKINTGTSYTEFKPMKKISTTENYCDFIVEGCKNTLHFTKQTQVQFFPLTKKINVLKTVQNQYEYHLQSNLRITNCQQCVIWLRVIDLSQLKKKKEVQRQRNLHFTKSGRRKTLNQEPNFEEDESIVTVNKMLTTAHNKISSLLQDEIGGTSQNLRRSSSLNKKLMEDQSESSDSASRNRCFSPKAILKWQNFKEQDEHKIEINRANTMNETFSFHTPLNRLSNSPNKTDMKLRNEKNFFSSVTHSPEKNNKKAEKEKKERKESNENYNNSNKNKRQILCIQMKPSETVQVILNSQYHFIELFQKQEKKDVRKKAIKRINRSQNSEDDNDDFESMSEVPSYSYGERYDTFQAIDAMMENNKEILLHSFGAEEYQQNEKAAYYLNERRKNNQVSESIIVRTEIETVESEDKKSEIFHWMILSPVVFVNKMPYQVKYRFSKEVVDVLETIRTAGKQIRKRSFQAIPMENVNPLSLSRQRAIKYEDITDMEVCINQYYNTFRLDHIVSDIQKAHTKLKNKQHHKIEKGEMLQGFLPQEDPMRQKNSSKDEEYDYPTFTNFLCLNTLKNSLQMMIEIKLTKHTMKICIYPQYIFLNMTGIEMKMQVLENNYKYPAIVLPSLNEQVYYKEYLKMSDEKLCSSHVLKQLFMEYQDNIGVFSGSLDENAKRRMIYGDHDNPQLVNIFNFSFKNQSVQRNRSLKSSNSSDRVIEYGPKNLKIISRQLDSGCYEEGMVQHPHALKNTTLVVFIPSLIIINKSEWYFFVKGEAEKLKKLPKHSVEYSLISSMVAVQACEEHEQIAYNEWMKISLNTMGTIYYSKEMNLSSGYESREYELRKKRLKKAPKLFFRIVMTKFEYGYQMLIEESEYPPVSFINKCEARVQICEENENVREEMDKNETAEYASKIPHYHPIFKLSIVQNYEFREVGHFCLDGETGVEGKNQQIFYSNNTLVFIFWGQIRVRIEEYKDKKIVILQDYHESNISEVRNDFLLEMLRKLLITIDSISLSLFTNKNKQITCFSLNHIELTHEKKNTKKYFKIRIGESQCFGYNSIQPSYLFHATKKKNLIDIIQNSGESKLNKSQVAINSSYSPYSPYSSYSSRFNFFNKLSFMKKESSPTPHPNQNILGNSSSSLSDIMCIELIIDYNKYATILEKCLIQIAPLTLVFNANIFIDYLKYYYHDLKQLIQKINQMNEANKKKKPSANEKSFLKKKRSEGNTLRRVNSFSSAELSKFEYHQHIPHHLSEAYSHHHHEQHRIGITQKTFIIENFKFEGSEVSIKCQNLENLYLFFDEESKTLTYFMKFIEWIRDLRPIRLNSFKIEYEQYTLGKILKQINVNSIIKEVIQIFLHYPLQQLYHIIFLTFKFLGLNSPMADQDQDDSSERMKTLGKILSTGFRLIKSVLFLNQQSSPIGKDVYRRTYMRKVRSEYNKNQILKQNQSLIGEVILRILNFKYSEWNYIEKTMIKRLQTKVTRLQRYSFPHKLIPYDWIFSRIKLAIDSHCGNKLFKKINHAFSINQHHLMGMTEEWFVLYNLEKDRWIVVRPQQVVSMRVENIKSKRIYSKQLCLTLLLQDQIEKEVMGVNDVKKKKQEHLQKFSFGNLLVEDSTIELLNEEINALKLFSYY